MRLYDDAGAGTVERARALRRRPGEPERRLRRGLRAGFNTVKWRRQVPIEPYFADFLCFSEKLVVEVDGDDHAWRSIEDTVRSTFIENQGYRVMRVANGDGMANLDGVIAMIAVRLADVRKGRP